MANRSLMRSTQISDAETDAELAAAFGQRDLEDITAVYSAHTQAYEKGSIVSGKVRKVVGGDVYVDIGFKSEGVVPEREWDDGGAPAVPGEEVEVLLEEVEEEHGVIRLSKRKAARIRAWEKIIREFKEGDEVAGKVTRKIKGGLLVDIGVNVFLPASQVDTRRPENLDDYINQTIKCLILTIDEQRRNIVVSRRQLLDRERQKQKEELLGKLQVGQVVRGKVKNIASFGAFVDLGGIDGLLHVTDMSWGRVGHPSEVVKVDEELEVMILSIDPERERIGLGLKQKEPSPWANIEARFPVGTSVRGEVVNITNYGAFVKLDEGIEGLVHISEMSWTRRINHPSEVLQVGDKVGVKVLAINKEKQEISLGLKQTQPNPWDEVVAKYPPETVVSGVVRNLTNYGAFVEIAEGVDGLLHVNDLSWVRKISNPSEVLKVGQTVECQVLQVDQERKRIALGMKQLKSDPWETDIPERYQPNQSVKGKVTKITNFGFFVELEPDLEGLLHTSEVDEKDTPKVGQEIECRVLRVDTEERRIGLSRRTGGEEGDATPAAASAAGTAAPAAKTPVKKAASAGSKELKGGVGGSGPLIDFARKEE